MDASQLAAYRQLCGAPDSEALPIAYPHLLAAAVHRKLMASKEFPVRRAGIVHIANRIEQRALLTASTRGRVRARIEGHRETERGQELELHTVLDVDGVPAWLQMSTLLLRRSAPRARGPRVAPAALTDARVVEFDAPANIGRRYARVSGDFNPIHLTALTARLFGFRRAIAHGMWSLARCAALMHDAIDPRRALLQVEFRSPILLPAPLRFERERDGAFALTDPSDARTYLRGSLSSPL